MDEQEIINIKRVANVNRTNAWQIYKDLSKREAPDIEIIAETLVDFYKKHPLYGMYITCLYLTASRAKELIPHTLPDGTIFAGLKIGDISIRNYEGVDILTITTLIEKHGINYGKKYDEGERYTKEFKKMYINTTRDIYKPFIKIIDDFLERFHNIYTKEDLLKKGDVVLFENIVNFKCPANYFSNVTKKRFGIPWRLHILRDYRVQSLIRYDNCTDSDLLLMIGWSPKSNMVRKYSRGIGEKSMMHKLINL